MVELSMYIRKVKLASLRGDLQTTRPFSRCIYSSRIKDAVREISRGQLTVFPTDGDYKRIPYDIPAGMREDSLHSYYEIHYSREKNFLVGRLLLPHKWLYEGAHLKLALEKMIDIYPKDIIIAIKEYEQKRKGMSKIYSLVLEEYSFSQGPFLGYCVKHK